VLVLIRAPPDRACGPTFSNTGTTILYAGMLALGLRQGWWRRSSTR
jgi:hypothetical protein